MIIGNAQPNQSLLLIIIIQQNATLTNLIYFCYIYIFFVLFFCMFVGRTVPVRQQQNCDLHSRSHGGSREWNLAQDCRRSPGTGFRHHRHQTERFPFVQVGHLLQRQLQLYRREPRGAHRRLRFLRPGKGLLDREELVGPNMGWQRLRVDGS